MLYILLMVALLCLAGCQAAPQAPREAAPPSRPLKVLMIGNSYTAMTYHIVGAWVEAHPDHEIDITLLKRGGWPLRSHLNHADEKAYDDGAVGLAETLAAEAFDAVTIQEQSTGATTVGRGQPESFRKDACELAELVRRMQAEHHAGHRPRILLLETWAKHPDWDGYSSTYTREDMQREIRDNYRAAAEACGAEVIPAGDAFERYYAMRKPPAGIETLHEPDHSHPSPLGCALSALVVCQTLYGERFEEAAIPRHRFLPEITPEQRQALARLSEPE